MEHHKQFNLTKKRQKYFLLGFFNLNVIHNRNVFFLCSWLINLLPSVECAKIYGGLTPVLVFLKIQEILMILEKSVIHYIARLLNIVH